MSSSNKPKIHPNQIIGQFQDLGGEILKQAASVPKDIGQAAMESLGARSSSTGQTGALQSSAGIPDRPKTEMEKFAEAGDEQTKKLIARKALEEIVNYEKKVIEQSRPTSIWEQIEQEKEEKKRQQEMQQAQGAGQLQQPTAKRKRGDLYGAHKKQRSTEIKTGGKD